MINKSYSSLTDKEAISGASNVFKGWNIATFILGAFSFLIGIAALPLRLILRDNIGERSIRPFAFILALGIHIYYFTQFDTLVAVISVLGIHGDPFDGLSGYQAIGFLFLFASINPYTLFLFWVFRRGIKHFRQKIREAQSGHVGYSYYRGESRFFSAWDKPTIYGFPTSQDSIRMLGEPKAIIVIGIATSFSSALLLLFSAFVLETESVLLVATLATVFATGLVISFDGLCLMLDEISLALNRRDKVLDMLDSEEDLKLIVGQKDEMKAERLQSSNHSKDNLSSEEEDDLIED